MKNERLGDSNSFRKMADQDVVSPEKYEFLDAVESLEKIYEEKDVSTNEKNNWICEKIVQLSQNL